MKAFKNIIKNSESDETDKVKKVKSKEKEQQPADNTKNLSLSGSLKEKKLNTKLSK